MLKIEIKGETIERREQARARAGTTRARHTIRIE